MIEYSFSWKLFPLIHCTLLVSTFSFFCVEYRLFIRINITGTTLFCYVYALRVKRTWYLMLKGRINLEEKISSW